MYYVKVLLLSLVIVLIGSTDSHVSSNSTNMNVKYDTFVVLSPYSYKSIDSNISAGITGRLKDYYSKHFPDVKVKVVTLYLNNAIINYGTSPECIQKIKSYNPKCVFITQEVLFFNIHNKIPEIPMYFINYNSEFMISDRHMIKGNLSDHYVNYSIDFNKIRILSDVLGDSLNNFYIIRNEHRHNSFNLSKLYIAAIHEAFPNADIDIFECMNLVQLRGIMKDLEISKKGFIILSIRGLLSEEGDYISEIEMLDEYLRLNKKHFEIGFYELSTAGVLMSCVPTLKSAGEHLADCYLTPNDKSKDVFDSILSMNYARMQQLNLIKNNANFFKYVDVLN